MLFRVQSVIAFPKKDLDLFIMEGEIELGGLIRYFGCERKGEGKCQTRKDISYLEM